MNLKERFPFLFFVILIIGIFGYSYRELFHWEMIATADLVPWFPTASEAYQSFYSTWSSRYFGGTSPLAPSEFIVQASLIALTGNAAMAQRIFYLSLLPLSAITMYLFLKYYTKYNAARIIISIAYALNGITIAWFLAGGYPYLVTHITFPLLMLYLIKSLEEKEKRAFNILVFTGILGFISSFYMYMYMLVWFGPFLIIFFIFEILSRRDSRYTFKTILLFLCSFGILALLLSPIIVNQLIMLSNYFTEPTKTFGLHVGYPSGYLSQSIKDNFSSEYTVIMFNNFSPFLWIFTFFSMFIKDKRRHYLGALLIATLIFLFSRMIMLGQIYDWFDNFPILFTLRSPSRLAFMIAWAFFLMMAILVDTWEKWALIDSDNAKDYSNRGSLQKYWANLSNKGRTVIFYTVICAIIIPSSIIYLTSDINYPFSDPYNNSVRFFSSGMDPSIQDIGEINPVFDDVHNWLVIHRQNEGFFRTAWIPSERLMVGKILLRYDPITMSGSNHFDHVFLTLMPFIQGWTENAGKLFSYSNVKYVIVYLEKFKWEGMQNYYTGSPRFSFQNPFGSSPTGAPEEYIALLNKQKDLKLIHNESNFMIYENLNFLPHITVYNKIFFIAPLSTINYEPVSSSAVSVANPGFEDGLNSWQTLNHPGAVYSVDNTINHLDRSSLRMELNQKGASASINQIMEVRENTSYSISVWMKSKNISELNIIVYFLNKENKRISINGSDSIHRTIKTGNNWSQSWSNILSSPGALKMEIHFTIPEYLFKEPNNPPVMWLDDISVKEIKMKELPVADQDFIYGTLESDTFPYKYIDGTPKNNENFPYDYLKGQMLVQIPNLLPNNSFFNSKQTLLVHGDFLNSDEEIDKYKNISDAIIFLGDVDPNKSIEQLYDSEALLFVHDAESSLIVSKGDNRFIENSSFSYGHGLELSGKTEAIKEFFAPREGYYRSIVRGEISENISLMINGKSTGIIGSGKDENSLSWYESEPVFLKSGKHRLSLSTESGKNVLDQIFILSTKHDEVTFTTIFSPKNLEFESSEINPSEYNVHVKSNGPFFIILGENFHEEWSGYTNTKKLEHIPAFPLGWANGFFSDDGGDHEIKIIFERQKYADVAINIWVIGWVCLILSILY
ncbi:MAG TPA: hypothetical protein VN368_01955, partial [Candidatus Methylomirabilis sp.]|nr:hypothetical protein [Candidatus Methylomirabilis sp.]